MNCVAHQSPGLWTHPRDRTAEYNRLPYWIDLAKTLERGRFDGLFLADVLGVYDVFGGSPDAALRNATQTPANEPLMLIPAMAAVTKHLGFGVTSNLSFEPPYPFARRMSTLDHLTEGRIGWNVVTGYLDSAARGRHSRAGRKSRAQSSGNFDVQHVHHHPRPHRGGGESEIRRLSQPHQSRGRADADVGMDRRRFLDLRSRSTGAPRAERRRPH